MTFMDRKEIEELVQTYGSKVNEGRTIKEIISEGEISALRNCKIYEGKVSDSLYGERLVTSDGIPVRLMYRSNRVSTHDKHRGRIPFKDQVLAVNHYVMLNLVKEVLGSSQFEVPGLSPTSTVIAAENLEPIGFENVLRSYMAESTTSTSLYQHWLSGKREFCGHKLPDNLSANCRLPYVMDTPSTKSKVDESVSPQYLFDNEICTKEEYIQIRNNSFFAFGIITEHDRRKGIIPVDTKLEHGRNHRHEIVLMDEVFTLDSTRRWRIDSETGFLELDDAGRPRSYSKEFVRGMEFNSQTGLLSTEQEIEVAVRYIEAIQHISGERFEPDLRSRDERIIESTLLILKALGIN
jgi:phosphoribosylaminoimidazole-succinocarboxamide synthase